MDGSDRTSSASPSTTESKPKDLATLTNTPFSQLGSSLPTLGTIGMRTFSPFGRQNSVSISSL